MMKIPFSVGYIVLPFLAIYSLAKRAFIMEALVAAVPRPLFSSFISVRASSSSRFFPAVSIAVMRSGSV